RTACRRKKTGIAPFPAWQASITPRREKAMSAPRAGPVVGARLCRALYSGPSQPAWSASGRRRRERGGGRSMIAGREDPETGAFGTRGFVPRLSRHLILGAGILLAGLGALVVWAGTCAVDRLGFE